jgi:hypothetical protein
MYEYDQEAAVVPDNEIHVTEAAVPAAKTTTALEPELLIVTLPVELFCTYHDCPNTRVEVTGSTTV